MPVWTLLIVGISSIKRSQLNRKRCVLKNVLLFLCLCVPQKNALASSKIEIDSYEQALNLQWLQKNITNIKFCIPVDFQYHLL